MKYNTQNKKIASITEKTLIIGTDVWDGTAITHWRCGSCNKTNGHKICSNRYVTDETLKKLFVMSWNEIVEKQINY